MDTIIYIVGPTGVGKTALALQLAKKFGGELVNADSVQVYKGLDIISGKDHPQDTHIHLLDIVSPTEPFSVSHFQKLGEEVIGGLLTKEKLPIVVGGTGLYVKALIDGIPTKDVPYDKGVRSELESLQLVDLRNKLSKKRLEQMNESDRQNKRRLIRAIEIEKSGFQNFTTTIPFPAVRHIQIGLSADREKLRRKIEKRVEDRLETGAMNEAEKLFKSYKKLSPQVKNANGYKQIFQYLHGEISFDEALERWKLSEYRHAKNQMTWFVKDERIKWFDIESMEYETMIEDFIKQTIL